jgi:hypothetical protein
MPNRFSSSRREYDRMVDLLLARQPHIRRGQAMMMALKQVSPGMHKILSGSNYDPFYRDDRIPALESQLSLLWGHFYGRRDESDEDREEITINLELSWPFL